MAPARKRRRPPRRPPQLNAEVDDVLRAEMQAIERVVGDLHGGALTHGGVLRVLVDAFLGRRPPLSQTDRGFFDAIMRRWHETARRKPRGQTDD